MSALLWKHQAPSPSGYIPLPIAPNVAVHRERASSQVAPDAVASDDADAVECPSASSCPAAGGVDKGKRGRLVEAMEAAGWVQAKAARLLGITPRQLGYALRKHEIEIKKF